MTMDKEGREEVSRMSGALNTENNTLARELVALEKKPRLIFVVDSRLIPKDSTDYRQTILGELSILRTVASKLGMKLDIFTEASNTRFSSSVDSFILDNIHYPSDYFKEEGYDNGRGDDENLKYLSLAKYVNVVNLDEDNTDALPIIITRDPLMAVKAVRKGYKYLLMDDPHRKTPAGGLVIVDSKTFNNTYTLNFLLKSIKQFVNQKERERNGQ